MDDDELRLLLRTLTPSARDKLRRVLILDQPDRDAIASELLRYGDAHGDGWADVIDTLKMNPDVRRQVVRLQPRSTPRASVRLPAVVRDRRGLVASCTATGS